MLKARSLRLVALAGLALAAIATACSSSETTVTDTPADSGSTTTGDASTSGFDSGGGTSDSGGGTGDSGGTKETGTPGPQYDAGAPITLDAGDAGSIPCTTGGIAEVEPNGTAGTATDMVAPTNGVTTICGNLSTTDAGTDVDFVKFKLQSTTTSFYVQWAGNVNPEFSVKGTVVSIGAAGSFQKDDPYVVELKPVAPGTGPWRLSVFETK